MSDSTRERTLTEPLGLFALVAIAIGAAWWWLGYPVTLPPSPLAAGEKLYCVSYAPFRDGQDPLVKGTTVSAQQIDEDMALLAHFTDCIRTYSVDDGGENVLISAQRYGLKVLYGIWVSNEAERNRRQIAAAVEYAKKYADVINGIVVGNEVLLRGEMSGTDLEKIIREVKSQVTQPVTYADVWEFWLRNADLQNAVDFVTIHILPYWEDFPIPASQAAAHVVEIRKMVAAAVPNKDILIGETGWPSEGRMREGALPSPSEQARVIEDTLAAGKRENFKINVIEAFDQPWKRALEGAAGRYWGIFDRSVGGPKFTLGGSVSDHPQWPWLALAGILLAALTFGSAWRSRSAVEVSRLWPRIAGLAFFSALFFGWSLELVPIQSFSVGTWMRSLALALVAALAPVVCAAGCAASRSVPSFAWLLGRRETRDGLGVALVVVFAVLSLLAVEQALGLVFDARYRDFVFAPMSAAVVPFLVLTLSTPRLGRMRAVAETAFGIVLVLCAIYILPNESFANWQSVWFCAATLALAFILLRVRDAPG